MPASGGSWDALVPMLLLIVLPSIPAAFYLATLHGALAACAPANRRLAPGLVWLQLVPLLKVLVGPTGWLWLLWLPVLGVFWQFVVVVALSYSLGAELRARGVPGDPRPHLKLGLWLAGVATLTSLTPPPYVLPFAVSSLILWITYWIRIAGLRRRIGTTPSAPLVPASH